jgi:glucoamylase
MRRYSLSRPSMHESDLAAFPQYFLALMMRNVASAGFRFSDPADPARFSMPGCIIASPSYSGDQADVTQNYVFNWTRDAAIAVMEMAFGSLPIADAAGSGPLDDYVAFAAACQRNTDTQACACFTIEAQPRRHWPEQNDGPALQTLALLACYDQLDADAQDAARSVIDANLRFILDHYTEPNTNLWEEVSGQSFFTRSVQLRCLRDLQANTIGLGVPAAVPTAISWLSDALTQHWDEANGHYTSVLQPANPRPSYDPNIDIVMASVYGAVPTTDERLLSTAGLLRQQWTDARTSSVAYSINEADAVQQLGPLLGRYPGDVYDGDNDTSGQDHPWALCTANFAELYYRLAAEIGRSGRPVDVTPLTALFFQQIGVASTTTPTEAARRLITAGDCMLKAIVYHSDHLELSEQFDGTTGYEKSVRNLTWSYAAFLSAMRARSGAQTTLA